MALKILSLILISISCFARPIRIGIIDTGYFTKYKDNNKIHFCENAPPKDFTTEGIEDQYPHGQNILHTIIQDLNYKDYCVVVIKALSLKFNFNVFNYIMAYNYAIKAKVDILNLSFAGDDYNRYEDASIKTLLNSGTKVVVAIGNKNLDLSTTCNVYPACVDNRLYVVGCTEKNNKKCSFSNYGKIGMKWEMGRDISAGGITQSGTSQAAAKHTNKLVKLLIQEQKK